MKELLLKSMMLFGFFFIIHMAYSQPTLDGTNVNPQIGENVILDTWDPGSVSQGNAGAAVTWDFSNISSTGTNSYTWIAASSSSYHSNFPSANMTYETGGVWDFYLVSSSEYSRCGAVTSVGAIIPFSDREKLLSFPFTYNSSFIDNFSGNYSYSGYSFYRHGNVTVTGDAYGTLILPSVTYTDVLRVKTVEDYQDDYMSSPYMYYETEVYIWYKAGIHQPILSITDFTAGTSYIRYGLFYNQASGIDAGEIADLSFTVYPNPAIDHINVAIKNLHNENIVIQLFDLNGSEIYQETMTYTSEAQIDISAFPEGIYMIRLTSGNQVGIGKLIIKRSL